MRIGDLDFDIGIRDCGLKSGIWIRIWGSRLGLEIEIGNLIGAGIGGWGLGFGDLNERYDCHSPTTTTTKSVVGLRLSNHWKPPPTNTTHH